MIKTRDRQVAETMCGISMRLHGEFTHMRTKRDRWRFVAIAEAVSLVSCLVIVWMYHH
jgi:hypothetical protein